MNEAAVGPGAQGALEGLRFVLPDGYFDRSGLMAVTAAEYILERLPPLGIGDDGGILIYEGGVYMAAPDVIQRACVALLGDRFRPAHAGTIEAVIRVSPHVSRVSSEPIADGRLINITDGLVDWKSGSLLPHGPDLAGIVQYPVEWDPHAECPAFDKFLATILPPDCLVPINGGSSFAYRLLGYILHFGNPMQLAVLFYGKGANGKSRLLHVIEQLVGVENISNVTLADLETNRFRAAELHGKPLNIAGDIDPRFMRDTGAFKTVTGGDTMMVERKYAQPFTFRPWALPVYSANNPFGSADDSEGLWRRFLIVPFPFDHRESHIPPAEIDAANEAELAGIFRKSVDGLRDLMAAGSFDIPETVARAKLEFRASSDSVRGWFDECAVLERGNFTTRSQAWESYEMWCDDSEAKKVSRTKFYQRLAAIAGVTEHRMPTMRGFIGMRIE